jgi:hypothetical protein
MMLRNQASYFYKIQILEFAPAPGGPEYDPISPVVTSCSNLQLRDAIMQTKLALAIFSYHHGES